MTSDSSKLETTLSNMTNLLKKTSEDIAALKKTGNLDTLSKDLTPLEYAKLCSSVGYSINCLYKGSLLLSRSLYEIEWNR